MEEDGFPDWITETDRDILKTLFHVQILTPSVIAENIDKSREAVSRRLNMLQAGGFVNKRDRGKYELTEKGVITFSKETHEKGLIPIPADPEENRKSRERAGEEEKRIYSEFGMTSAELNSAMVEEIDRLREELPGFHSIYELQEKALDNLREKAKEEN